MARRSLDINRNALRYWGMTGFRDQDLDAYCRANDAEFMFARVNFSPGIAPSVIISTRTWKLNEGHYPAMMRFFSRVASTDIGRELSGSVLVHLEDGLFDFSRNKTRAVPLLAFGRAIDDTFGLLVPDPAFLESNGYLAELAEIARHEEQLKEPKINRIFWRGAASGTWFDNPDHWTVNARAKLVLKAKDLDDPSILDAKLTKVNHLPEIQQKMLHEKGLVAPYTDFYDFLKYKYLIDADGYYCAWRSLFLKLASRSLVIKVASDLEQWYFPLLEPWVHYVPLRSDSSDVCEVFSWVESHPEEVQQIIHNANKLVATITIEQEIEKAAYLCQRLLTFRRQ